MIDNVILDSLMTWARLQAPHVQPFTILPNHSFTGERRRVRLEISAMQTRIMCRVYLAEPRCIDNHQFVETDKGYIPCECGPLAETYIG